MEFKPRPKQAKVLEYREGKMGVSAVPGSGKTRTLSYLAANLIADNLVDDDQEVLIVTLVNSAANHFSRQVGEFVKTRGLLPNFGYRVRTLHGLANDIVRERPGLVALDKDFKIIDEREADGILQGAVTAWIRAHPDFGDFYLDPEMDENRRQFILQNRWPDAVTVMARAFIKQAKDSRLEPEDIRRGLDDFGAELPLAAMCHAIYVNYQRGLSYRGGVDFQDLIRLALKALELDGEYLDRLRHRWPYILEDEAQDSSLLQERILETLSGEKGNWVRVGDPNQAIYETFTTAKPEYLRNFLQRRDVKARELPNSGRSTKSIIGLANFLIEWTRERHPVGKVRSREPLTLPLIVMTPRGDPQPNPPDDPSSIYLHPQGFPPAEEIDAVVGSLKRWLPDNQDKTVAVLVPRNDRGANLVKVLKSENIDVVELLRSSSTTRETAGALVLLLDALTRPNASDSLARAYRVWRRDDRNDPELEVRVERVVRTLRKCGQIEDYLHPRPHSDWMDGEVVTALTTDDEIAREHLLAFREVMRRWQEAVVLPIDQLVLTLAQEIFITAADLAIAHSLALYLRRAAATNPQWRLPEFRDELSEVAKNKRRLVDLGEDPEGYDPEQHKGKVTIATMHAAKGLEWDRVYLMSVNTYNFPSAQQGDQFIGETWYVRDDLNLQAEALEQLERLADSIPFPYDEGKATQEARIEYAAERLRLLYVGITRARRELVLTFNTGRRGDVQQATPFVALQTYWEETQKV